MRTDHPLQTAQFRGHQGLRAGVICKLMETLSAVASRCDSKQNKKAASWDSGLLSPHCCLSPTLNPQQNGAPFMHSAVGLLGVCGSQGLHMPGPEGITATSYGWSPSLAPWVPTEPALYMEGRLSPV